MTLLICGLFLLSQFVQSIDMSEMDVPSLEVWKNYGEENDEPSPTMFNCTQFPMKTASSCACLKCNDETCILCCTFPWQASVCCLCHKCDACWGADWELITIAHISVFILFVLGSICITIIFFRIRYRAAYAEHSRFETIRPQCNSNQDTSNCSQLSTIDNLRDRPPPYVDAIAPPLYESPRNTISMSEPPPEYPGRTQSPIAHHI